MDVQSRQIPEMEKHPEPEIVYFPQTRFLAIQGHPEWMSAQPGFRKLCVDLVREYLFNESVK
jgi:hypothetical protein